MIHIIEQEKKKLLVQADECNIRETPSEHESIAERFNAKLAITLETLARLEADHQEIMAFEAEFNSLSNQRQNALSRLGQVQPLGLRQSLGRLALVESPYGYVFAVAGEIRGFVGGLMGYRTKLESYEKWKVANPDGLKVDQPEPERSESKGFFRWITQPFVN